MRFFLAVARRGGLTAASRELSVNQSTVFRRIGQLEDRLGARLFDREPRGYTLTLVGEEMLTHALRIEDDVLALGRAVIGADLEFRGTVQITTVDEVLERIAPHLKGFRDRYPGIQLELNTELRVFSLARREADVAIRPGTRPTEPDIIGKPLVRLAMAAYASPAYLDGRRRPGRISDLSEHDLIRFPERPRGSPLRSALEEGRVVCRANSMSAQAIATRAGIGVGLLPTFVGDRDAGLVRLFVLESPPDYHLWLLIHADLRQTARVRAFVEFMTAAIQGDRALYESGARRARARGKS